MKDDPPRAMALRNDVLMLLRSGDNFISKQLSRELHLLLVYARSRFRGTRRVNHPSRTESRHRMIIRAFAQLTFAAYVSIALQLSPNVGDDNAGLRNRYGRYTTSWMQMYCYTLDDETASSGAAGWPDSDCDHPDL